MKSEANSTKMKESYNCSKYGCGQHDCIICYPLQYCCADCGTEFDQPILNGQTHECLVCGYNQNDMRL